MLARLLISLGTVIVEAAGLTLNCVTAAALFITNSEMRTTTATSGYTENAIAVS